MRLRILRAGLAIGGVALGLYGYHLLRDDVHSPVLNAVASIAGQNRIEADDVATRAVQAAEGLTDLERATRDLEQVATMLRDLTRGFANVN